MIGCTQQIIGDYREFLTLEKLSGTTVYKYINVDTKKAEKLYENRKLSWIRRQWNAFTYEVFSENGKLFMRLYRRINHNAYMNLSAKYNTFWIISKQGKTYRSFNWLHLL